MFNRAFYKKQAKSSLKGRKKQAALISLIPVIFIVAFYFVYLSAFFKLTRKIYHLSGLYYSGLLALQIILAIVVYLIFSSVISLISFAYLRTVNDLQDQKPVTIKTLFTKFSHKAVTAMLWVTLWDFIWSIPFVAGMLVFQAAIKAAQTASYLSALHIFAIMVGLIIYATGFIILYAKMLSYGMIYYILADNHELSIRKALRLSIAVTKGSRENIFVMILSFYGWLLLGFLTLGIGFLWIWPYMTMAMRNAYLALKNNAISENILKLSDFTIHKKIPASPRTPPISAEAK